jgi:biopolymer transport protein ExbD
MAELASASGEGAMAAKLAGGGKGGRQLRQNADINVTPFVDVMLVLLIIFMVAAPLATTAIKIDLPVAAPNAKPQHRPTFISIRKGGETYVVAETDTQKVADLAGLAPVLAARLGGATAATSQTVLIRADRDVRYREFMAVVNPLQHDGYYRVALISEELG